MSNELLFEETILKTNSCHLLFDSSGHISGGIVVGLKWQRAMEDRGVLHLMNKFKV